MLKHITFTSSWLTCLALIVLFTAKPLFAEEGKQDDKKTRDKSVLLNPDDESWSRKAPDQYKVKFETSKGDVVIQVTRDWSPLGADRFYNLVDNGFYDDTRFFRIIDGFMAQIGINGDPDVSKIWREQHIKDEPVKQSNTRGRITYAKSNAPDSRTTQVFINYGDNSSLDGMGFAPFGEVIEGMDVVDALYADYGEGPPRGNGPSQYRIQTEGNPYLKAEFPKLDYVITAKIIQPDQPDQPDQ